MPQPVDAAFLDDGGALLRRVEDLLYRRIADRVLAVFAGE